jgi:hypothetical protein
MPYAHNGDCQLYYETFGDHELIEGMGHDYPRQVWQRWVDLVANFCLAE